MEDIRKVGLIRINGYSGGLHPLQIFAYVVYSSALAVFTICVFPFFDSSLQLSFSLDLNYIYPQLPNSLELKFLKQKWEIKETSQELLNKQQIASGVLYYISLGVMAILAFFCSYSDPTDPIIRREKEARKNNAEYDTIEYEYYCSTCISHVQDGSKHCRQCDRCVNGFDHHCKWLNNCIGKENYKIFYTLIASVFINSVIYCTFLAYSLKNVFTDDNNHSFDSYSNSSFITMKVFVWFYLIFIGLLGILDFNLLLFHTWLAHNKLTTYEYIINSRTAKQETIPYGICSGIQEFKQHQLNQNNFQSDTPYQKPKRRDTIQSKNRVQLSQKIILNKRKVFCCLKKKKKANSIVPIDGAEQNLDQNAYKSSNLNQNNEEQDNNNNLNPFSQNLIEGLIEKSICNSADVQEEDLRTEIGKQDNNPQHNQPSNNQKQNKKMVKSKGRKGTQQTKFTKSHTQEIQFQNLNGLNRNINNQDMDVESQNQNFQNEQYDEHDMESGGLNNGKAVIKLDHNTSPHRQSLNEVDPILKKKIEISTKKLNNTDYMQDQNNKLKQKSIDLFLQPISTSFKHQEIDSCQQEKFSQAEKDINLNSDSFRERNEQNGNSQRNINIFNNNINTDNGETQDTKKARRKNLIQNQKVEVGELKEQSLYSLGKSSSPLKKNNKLLIEQLNKINENKLREDDKKPSFSHRNTHEFSDRYSEKGKDTLSQQLRRGGSANGSVFSPNNNSDDQVILHNENQVLDKNNNQNQLKIGNIFDNLIEINQNTHVEQFHTNVNYLTSNFKTGEQTPQEKATFIQNNESNKQKNDIEF